MKHLQKDLPDFGRAYSVREMRKINHELFLKQPVAAGRLIPEIVMYHYILSGWYPPLLLK